MRLLLNIVIIIILLQMVSCANVQIPIDPNKIYKMDMDITNKCSNCDGLSATGMIVLPYKPLYTLVFETSEKINFISFRTCSREETANDPSSGLSRRKFLINYAPNEIERAGNCSAMISAFNETGMRSTAWVDFKDPSTTLPAENICGGITTKSEGVSVCQERTSSIERIKFDVEVITDPDKGCELDSPSKGKEFTYRVKKNFCQYVFVEAQAPNRVHRLTVFGYEQINVR